MGHSPIMCHEVSGSSLQSLQVGETSGFISDSCLLSLLCPVIIWVTKPSSFLDRLSSALDVFLFNEGNHILVCLAVLV